MKTFICKLIILGILMGSVFNSEAWLKVGVVVCDANTNGVIDSEDLPVPSVLVVVTNSDGTYSNANWTTAEGIFVVQLPNEPGTFVDYIHPDTLPAGTTEVLPGFSTFTTSETDTIITNNFLLENPECVSVSPPPPPPPPPPTNGLCWLTGGGTIRAGRGQPDHSFGGVVNPGCHPGAAGGGNWNDVWHAGKLHFKALQIDVVGCGNLADYPPGSRSPRSPFNYIDFEGVGTLRGVAGNHTDYGMVYFSARAVDLQEPGRGQDQLYLRVYDTDGNTLLLISGDQTDPLDVAPVSISTGNLQIHPCMPKPARARAGRHH